MGFEQAIFFGWEGLGRAKTAPMGHRLVRGRVLHESCEEDNWRLYVAWTRLRPYV